MNRQLIQTNREKCQNKINRLGRKQIMKFQEFLITPTENLHKTLLTDQDQLLLNQIRDAYQIRTQYFHPLDILPELLLNNDFILHVSTLSELINARSITILRLIVFLKLSSPQFQALNVGDKVALVKFNIPALLWLNTALFYNPITNTFCEDEQYDFIFNGKNLLDFYGLDIYNRIIKYLSLLHEFIQIDSIILFLLLLILFFSHFSSCKSLAEPILCDYHHIRQTQHFYITLLVQILIEKFGEQHGNFLLAKLILICLNIQNLSRDVSEIESTQILDENILSLMKVFLMK
jgi:hypothetical protein